MRGSPGSEIDGLRPRLVLAREPQFGEKQAYIHRRMAKWHVRAPANALSVGVWMTSVKGASKQTSPDFLESK